MSYEEYVNEEAMELTEETPAEEIPAQEPALEETPAEEELVIEYSVEEPAEDLTVDEDLFDVNAEEEIDFEIGDEAEEEVACDSLAAKCDEIRAVCRDTVNRLARDLEATNYNPYIRSTTTYRYEILKKSTDEEPVDVFEFQRTNGFSLRAMAITTALVAAADVAVGKFLRKRLKK